MTSRIIEVVTCINTKYSISFAYCYCTITGNRATQIVSDLDLKNTNSLNSIDIFTNNQLHKIDISVNHLIAGRVRSTGEGYVLTRVCPSINLFVHTWGGGTPARSSWGVPQWGGAYPDGGTPPWVPPHHTWPGDPDGWTATLGTPIRPAQGGTKMRGYPTSSST